MAKDDFFVIAYRILLYLYTCMKEGQEPDIRDVSFEKLGIPERYWVSVIENLIIEGYVRGIAVKKGLSGSVYISSGSPAITVAGIQFLQENSAMAKARDFLKDLKEIIPGL